jgi:hypothetical protein
MIAAAAAAGHGEQSEHAEQKSYHDQQRLSEQLAADS